MKNLLKNIVLALGCTLLFVGTSNAQYQLNNRLVQQNKLGINMAYAGEKEKTRIALVCGFTPNKLADGSVYFWQQATFDIPLTSNLATGTVFTNIEQGDFNQLEVKQAFAYKVTLSAAQSLSVGFSFGLNRKSVDFSNGFSPNGYVDMSDPYLNGGYEPENNLNMEVGLVYKLKNFEFSIAMPSLLEKRLYNKAITVYSEYKFEISDKWDVVPSVLMVQTEHSRCEVTTSVNAVYMKKSWLQIGYVGVNQFVIGCGVDLKGLGIGYNFALPFDNKFSSMVGNTHQIGLFFNF
jgi:type IX secretion system PorP/SprF family membrane protein